MRRIFSILAAFGFLGTTFGCHHTAGVCDCELTANGHSAPPPLAAEVIKPVPAKEAPRTIEKVTGTVDMVTPGK